MKYHSFVVPAHFSAPIDMNELGIELHVRGAEKALEIAAKAAQENRLDAVRAEIYNAQSELAGLRRLLKLPADEPGKPESG